MMGSAFSVVFGRGFVSLSYRPFPSSTRNNTCVYLRRFFAANKGRSHIRLPAEGEGGFKCLRLITGGGGGMFGC